MKNPVVEGINNDLLRHAKRVMGLLEEHGASIVPHLMDNDENAGEFLRQAIRDAERVKAYQAPYTPDNFKEVFEDRDGGAEEYGVFEKETK